MSRQRLTIGTFGDIGFRTSPNGRVVARARSRDWDGKTRPVRAAGDTRKSAERALMIRDSVREKDPADASLRARPERLLADLGDSLPFEGADGVDSFVEVYNGIKHASRAEPDVVDVLNARQRGVLVVRAWAAAELVEPLDELKTRLKDDSQQQGFVKAT